MALRTACPAPKSPPALLVGCSGSAVGANRLPVLQLEAKSPCRKKADDGRQESAIADSAPGLATGDVNLEDPACGLARLGVPATRSRQMIDAAIAAQPCGLLTEANVLRRAIASIGRLVAGARYEPLQMNLEPPERFVAGLRLVA